MLKLDNINLNEINDNYNSIVNRINKYNDNKGKIVNIPLATLKITVKEAKKYIDYLKNTIQELNLKKQKAKDEVYKWTILLVIKKLEINLSNFQKVYDKFEIYLNIANEDKKDFLKNPFHFDSKIEISKTNNNLDILKLEISKYKNFQKILNIKLNVNDKEESELEKDKYFVEKEIIFLNEVNSLLSPIVINTKFIKSFEKRFSVKLYKKDFTIKKEYELSIKDISKNLINDFTKDFQYNEHLYKKIIYDLNYFIQFEHKYNFDTFLNYFNVKDKEKISILDKINSFKNFTDINLLDIKELVKYIKSFENKMNLEWIKEYTENFIDIAETTRFEDSKIFSEKYKEIVNLLHTGLNWKNKILFDEIKEASIAFYKYQENTKNFLSLEKIIKVDYEYLKKVSKDYNIYLKNIKNKSKELYKVIDLNNKILMNDIKINYPKVTKELNNNLKELINYIQELITNLKVIKEITTISKTVYPISDYIEKTIYTNYNFYSSIKLKINKIKNKLINSLYESISNKNFVFDLNETWLDSNKLNELLTKIEKDKWIIDNSIYKYNKEVKELISIYKKIKNYSYSFNDNVNNLKNKYINNKIGNLTYFATWYIVSELIAAFDDKFEQEKEIYEENLRIERRRKQKEAEAAARRRRKIQATARSSKLSNLYWSWSSSSWNGNSSSFSSSSSLNWFSSSYGWSSSF